MIIGLKSIAATPYVYKKLIMGISNIIVIISKKIIFITKHCLTTPKKEFAQK